MKSAFVLSVLCLGLALGPHLSNADKEVTLEMDSCAPGTLFDVSKKQCTAGIIPTPINQTTPGTATPQITAKYHRCVVNGRFPYAYDCKKFFQCTYQWNGTFKKDLYTCHKGHYYNIITTFCSSNVNVCRVGSRPRTLKAASLTSSVCTSDTERFEDPESCNHYYLCSRVGEVLVPHRYSCPEGSVFSPDSGSCTNPENYDCQN